VNPLRRLFVGTADTAGDATGELAEGAISGVTGPLGQLLLQAAVFLAAAAVLAVILA